MADLPTVPVRRGSEKLFLRKAREFARQMERALEAGDLNVAASSASHCVISAADALLAHEKGVRSRAKDHGVVVRLVSAAAIPGAAEKAAQVEEVLALKHVAEYDDRDVTKGEAERAVKKAARFLEWVEKSVER